MNIVLIGYRGVGKSTIAEIIAQKTGCKLMNLDAMIVRKQGLSIPEIVSSHGWEYFRDAESEALDQAVAADQQVLDCGGGIILRKQNREKLKKTGPVFWLRAPVHVIAERIKYDNQRPSLTGKSFVEEIEQVLEEREPLYQETSDHVIKTDELSAEECARRILDLAGHH